MGRLLGIITYLILIGMVIYWFFIKYVLIGIIFLTLLILMAAFDLYIVKIRKRNKNGRYE